MSPWLLFAWGLLLTISTNLFVYLSRKPSLRDLPALVPFASISDLPYILYNAFNRASTTRSKALHDAHKNLGPVLVLGPNRISFSCPEAIRDIYGTATKCMKGDQYTTPGGIPNIFTETNKHEHAVKRKRLSNAFATSNLITWEQKIAKNIHAVLVRLDAQKGKTVDWRYLSNLFTLDAILSIGLSRDSGFVRAGTDRTLIEQADGSYRPGNMIPCVRSGNAAFEPIVWSPTWFPLLRWLTMSNRSYRHQWFLSQQWSLIVKQEVHRRMLIEAKGEQLDDIFACLLQDSKGNKLDLDEEEIASEVMILRKFTSDRSECSAYSFSRCRI